MLSKILSIQVFLPTASISAAKKRDEQKMKGSTSQALLSNYMQP